MNENMTEYEMLAKNDKIEIKEMSEKKVVLEEDEVSSKGNFPVEEDLIMLTASDIKTICSCLLLIVFIIAMIFEISRPESLMATAIMFISFISFVLIAVTDRD